MVSAKLSAVAGATLGAALLLGAVALPALSAPASEFVVAQDETPPADSNEPAASPEDPAASGGDSSEAPAAGDTEQPSAAPDADPSTAAPSPEGEQPSGSESDPQNDGASAPPSDDQTTNEPSNGSEPAAATAEPAAPQGGSSNVDASKLKIGSAVFGADGAQIGEVNGVKSDDAGKVQEILVTLGGSASINAKVFSVTADKITDVSDGVKLSLSSEEAKQLPVIDNSSG